MFDNHTWIGGLVQAPAFLKNGRYRPTLAMWMTPGGGPVAKRLCHPEEAQAALRLLLAESLRSHGRKSRPTRLQAIDDVARESLRGLEGCPPVVVAPNSLFEIAAYDHMGYLPELGPPDTYLESDVNPDTVFRFFEGMQRLDRAGLLVEAAPMLAQVDIPSLDVHGACVWVGEEVSLASGFIVFRSLEQYESYMHVHLKYTSEWCEDDDRSMLVSTFTEKRQFASSMHREIRTHRWPLHDARFVPRFDPYDASGIRRPARNADVEIAAVVGTALAQLLPSPCDEPTSPRTRTTKVCVGSNTHVVAITAPHLLATEELLDLSIGSDF
jgi:hypothetical protein